MMGRGADLEDLGEAICHSDGQIDIVASLLQLSQTGKRNTHPGGIPDADGITHRVHIPERRFVLHEVGDSTLRERISRKAK